MFKLYSYFRSTAAYRVRIALAYKGIDYQVIPVHLLREGGEQHQKAYRDKNPQGLVPFLEPEEGPGLSQSMAIIEYLEETHPTPSLLPKDPFLRAKARGLAYMVTCDIHPLNNLRVLKYLEQVWTLTEAQRTEWMHHWMREGFSALEIELERLGGQGPHALGSDFSWVDVVVIPQCYNAHRFGLDLKAYPRLSSIERNGLELPWIQSAIPEAQIDAP